METKTFINGFTSWYETHHVIVEYLSIHEDSFVGGVLEKTLQENGMGGVWELAKDLTDEFEEANKETEWGKDKDFLEELEEFLSNKKL